MPSDLQRIAFIGNSMPRLCGIATFTSHLRQAVAEARPSIDTSIVAMNDHGQAYKYPAEVAVQINDGKIEDYIRAAQILNAGDFDAVVLQHEFGIFGGEAGGYILELLSRLTMPLITTFHTVLEKPSTAQRKIMDKIIALSSRVIVMAEKGRDLLLDVYRTPPRKIEVIAHGVPDFEFVEPDAAKQKFGLGDKSVILTFGLLCPNKGIDVMIDAMPGILNRKPDAVYVVLGATHPNLVREQGETYRQSLVARAAAAGVADNVVFLDQFVDEATLLEYISACDVYVTPYLNETQMTSGTLAYSFGLGRAVVSTPYWHAQELLANGKGELVPFSDSAVTGNIIADLLTDDDRRNSLREQAYASSRNMVWLQVGRAYLAVVENVLRARRLRVVQNIKTPFTIPVAPFVAPGVNTSHLSSMCDDTGLFQHAVYTLPDRNHGYCVDDNARALLLGCTLNEAHLGKLPDSRITDFASFVQHAWNPDNRRFRNFMSFDRRWLEDQGSEDSHGRTVWALGICAATDTSPSRKLWASQLFADAVRTVEGFTSPRAWAFALLGLAAHCISDEQVNLRTILAERLVSLLAQTEREGWIWFEPGLSYDNARLPQALIATGLASNNQSFTDTGLRSLRWLVSVQTAPDGHFRPVGSESFGSHFQVSHYFDQQPLEAAATISACRLALQADGNAEYWQFAAVSAFSWFTGANDLMLPLVDFQTGACHDGLHPDRVNENCGAESVLSYLMGLCDMHMLARDQEDYPNLVPLPILPARIQQLQYLTRN
jgi:glycosyltransferase involved in cell wall biosynthesis